MTRLLLVVPAALLLLAACDTEITGTGNDNAAPQTELSVRDTSLVDDLDDPLTSTVFVAWSGTDPDGYVPAFELRFYPQGQALMPDERWTRTTARDSLVLLPIPAGRSTANVVFEVRAIDNEGLADPTPARTVFPIRNSPPTIALNSFETPPDTSWHIFSLSWEADDPEGVDNLARIEVAFNDSTRFTALPPDVDFVTFQAQIDREDPAQDTTSARVYLGRGFQRSDLSVPGLRLDAENTVYLRAVDQTDTTSAIARFPTEESESFVVRKPEGRVLLVNDYRSRFNDLHLAFHRDVLRGYLEPGSEIDVWNLTRPFQEGSAGNVPRSDAIPSVPDPTLRRLLAEWDHIYWFSSGATSQIAGNNLPLVAGALDLFFAEGGRLMVHVPVQASEDLDANEGNAAILTLPLSDVIAPSRTLIDGEPVRRFQINEGDTLIADAPVPGVGAPLPALVANRAVTGADPFATDGASIVPLYQATWTYVIQQGRIQVRDTWTGPSASATMNEDATIGLFGLPLIDDQSGALLFTGLDGSDTAPRCALRLMLAGLDFPGDASACRAD